MWCWNRDPKGAFEFIERLEFDVLCLQEVTEEALHKLKSLPYALHYAPEVDRIFKGTRETHYVAILSRYPMSRMGVIDLPDWSGARPLRSRLFARFMMILGYWTHDAGNRHAIYADVEGPRGLIRVFNLHLVLMSPYHRLIELETSLGERLSELPTIVTGDFNIIESPKVTILNWILGGKFTDALFYSRERMVVEERFAEYELTNALRGQTTHPFSRSQLDHILVSKSFHIKNAHVVPDSFGSDHHPIFADIT